MWTNIDKKFSTPPSTWRKQRPFPSPMSERKRSVPTTPVNNRGDLFHVIHKVPAGDSPYVRAKHIQLIEKDPSKAVSMFWAAINAGDRVDSALKDMAVVMKQLDRSDEAIEAIKSFRHLCPYDSQESLDNVLIELYKRSGRIEEEIEMLQHKLKNIEEGVAFGGAKTKIARSQGKKIQITIEQERSRILGNLAWAYLQQSNYEIAEKYYRRALSMEADKNKQCNLAICLMHMNRMSEANALLQAVRISAGNKQMDCSYAKSFERAVQMLNELESPSVFEASEQEEDDNQENRSPSLLPAKGNSNSQVTDTTNGGQDHRSTFCLSRNLANGHDEDTVLVNQQDRTTCFQEHLQNKNGVFGYDKGSLKCISYGPTRSLFVDNQRKSSCLDNRSCVRSSPARMKGNSSCSPEVGSFLHQKTYASPAAVRKYMEAQFTRPRKPSWEFSNEKHRKERWGPIGNSNIDLSSQQNVHTDNAVLLTQPRRSSSCMYDVEDQRRGKWREKSVGSSIRKLTFEQTITAENVPEHALQIVNGQLVVSPKDKSEIGSQDARTALPSPTNEEWTVRSQKEISQVKDEAVDQRTSQAVVNGDWKDTCWKNDGFAQIKNQAVSESGLQHILDGIQRMNTWGNGDDKQKFELEESKSSITSVVVDNGTGTGAIQSIAAEVKSGQDFFLGKGKKSWADMVEEEEKESSSESNLRVCLHMEAEEYNDENLHSNIMYPSPCPQNYIDYLSRKLKDSFDVKVEGEVTSRKAGPLTRNPTVRRSLCFDQPELTLTGHFFSSPLPNKGLKFENRNSAPVKYKDDGSGVRRNRLQVFQDITPFPDSP